MPRLPAKQREAEKIATKLSNGSYAAAAIDSPAQHSWEVRFETNLIETHDELYLTSSV
jgi:hypothetical protein